MPTSSCKDFSSCPSGPLETESPTCPFPDANLTLWGGFLYPSASSVLASVKRAISTGLQNNAGGLGEGAGRGGCQQ